MRGGHGSIVLAADVEVGGGAKGGEIVPSTVWFLDAGEVRAVDGFVFDCGVCG